MNNISDVFGSLVFNDTAMRARLPKATYKSITDESLFNLQISGVDKNFRYTYISLNVEDTFENTQRVIKKLGLSTP
mgnify:CR=1 FL=1